MKKLVLLACLFLAVASCKKDEPTPSTGGGGTPIQTTVNSMSMTIDGANLSLTNGSGGSYAWSGYAYSGVTDTVYGELFWVMDNNTSGKPRVQITFGHDMSVTEFQTNPGNVYADFFTTGDHCYDWSCTNSRMTVYFYDENGTMWSSGGGVQDSTAIFSVNSSSQQTDNNGVVSQKMKATFTCKVFDMNGNSKSITDGAVYMEYKR